MWEASAEGPNVYCGEGLWLLMMLVDTSWLRAPVHLVFKRPPPHMGCSLWALIGHRRWLCSQLLNLSLS